MTLFAGLKRNTFTFSGELDFFSFLNQNEPSFEKKIILRNSNGKTGGILFFSVSVATQQKKIQMKIEQKSIQKEIQNLQGRAQHLIDQKSRIAFPSEHLYSDQSRTVTLPRNFLENNSKKPPKSPNQKVFNQKIPNQKVSNQKISNQKFSNQKDSNQKSSNQKVSNQKSSDQNSVPVEKFQTIANIPPTRIKDESVSDSLSNVSLQIFNNVQTNSKKLITSVSQSSESLTSKKSYTQENPRSREIYQSSGSDTSHSSSSSSKFTLSPLSSSSISKKKVHIFRIIISCSTRSESCYFPCTLR